MNKFDCLVHEMLLIRELTPSLNAQSDLGTVHFLRDRGGRWDFGGGHAKKNGFKGGATPKNMKKKGGSSEKKAMKKWYEVFIN